MNYSQEFKKLIQEKNLDFSRACMFITAVNLYNSGHTDAFNPFLELVGDSSEEFDKYRILLVNKDYEEDKWIFRVKVFEKEVVEDDVWKWLLDNVSSNVVLGKRDLYKEASNLLNSYEWNQDKLLKVIENYYETAEFKKALPTYILDTSLLRDYREFKENTFKGLR